jgi:hypothetical protein
MTAIQTRWSGFTRPELELLLDSVDKNINVTSLNLSCIEDVSEIVTIECKLNRLSEIHSDIYFEGIIANHEDQEEQTVESVTS